MELQLIVIFIASLICSLLSFWLGYTSGTDKAFNYINKMIESIKEEEDVHKE